MATKTRISAYSTRPWPFSLGANNMWAILLSFGFPVRRSGVYRIVYWLGKSARRRMGVFLTFMLVLNIGILVLSCTIWTISRTNVRFKGYLMPICIFLWLN